MSLSLDKAEARALGLNPQDVAMRREWFAAWPRT